jgi:hypothetical protein
METRYTGLEEIELLKPHFIADILSDDDRLLRKINEIAEKVNIIMQLLNSQEGGSDEDTKRKVYELS